MHDHLPNPVVVGAPHGKCQNIWDNSCSEMDDAALIWGHTVRVHATKTYAAVAAVAAAPSMPASVLVACMVGSVRIAAAA